MTMNIFRIFNKRQLRDIDLNRWLLIAIATLVIGLLVALLIGPEITQLVVKYLFTLMRGSYLRNQQRKLPLVYNVYCWNTTNPEEVMQGGKPKLQEIGPFVLHEIKSKINMNDDDDDDTLSYDIVNELSYQPNLTQPLTGDEILTTIHPFFVPGLVKTTLEMPEMIEFVKAGINNIFDNPTSLFLSMPVKYFLYERVNINCDVQEFSAKAICAAIANEDSIEKINGSLKHLAYSLLFQLNQNGKQGNYKVLRGLENVHDVGKIVTFNGEPQLEYFDDDACNVINGTDELVFGPFMGKNDIEIAYEYQACRAFKYEFDSVSDVKGHKSVRKILKQIQQRPNCDCPNGCLPDGVLDLDPCLEYPVVAAMPHFLTAGTEVQNMFDGLSPQKEIHYNGYDFDLLTGVVLRYVRRWQVNFRVVPIEAFPMIKNLGSISQYPTFWFEEILVSTPSEDRVISRIHFWDVFLRIVGWILFSSGLIVATISTLALQSQNMPITPESTGVDNHRTTGRQNTEENGSIAEPETPDEISSFEQQDQSPNNDFELYNRVQISTGKSDPHNVHQEEEEDEGIDGR